MPVNEQKTVRVGPFDIPESERDRLADLARLNERSFAAEVRIALRSYLLDREARLSADG